MGTSIVFEKTGQTVSHIPPARVTEATYKIENLNAGLDSADRVIGSGDATAPSWEITSSAAAGVDQRNPRKVSTASTTGPSFGDMAVIVAPDGTREVFRIKKISANSYIESETDLAQSYPVGSKVYGIELSAEFPDADAADEALLVGGRLQVTWTYTIDGELHSPAENVQFFRQTSSVGAAVGKAVEEIRTCYPDMPTRLAQGGDLDKIVQAMAVKVANDLRRHERDPELFMMGPQAADLIVARTLCLAAEHGYAPGKTDADRRWREEVKAEYAAMLAIAVSEEPGQEVVLKDLETDQPAAIPLDPPRWAQTINTPVLQGLDRLWDL